MDKDKDQWLNRIMNEGGINRRRFLAGTGKLGLAAMSTGMLANFVSTAALADTEFDWKKHKGKKIKLLLNKHPYTNATISYLENFKKLTGIEVEYDIFPEDVYFQKVTSSLSSGSSQYDIFMTGAYQLWQYGPAGYIEDLNPYLSNPQKTANTYDWQDIHQNIRNALAWSGKVGDPLGGPDAHQWAVPMAHEIYDLTFNQSMLKKAGVEVPQNLPDLIHTAEKLQKDVPGIFGVATRGSRSWATIHPGYLSGLVNYGGTDFHHKDGKLVSAVDSDACKKFTKLWIEMEQKVGPKDWTSYTWYDCGQAVGSGKCAIMYDADCNGFFQNSGTKEAGHLAYSAFAPNPQKSDPTSNIWIWALAMNKKSTKKDAAWYFLQWATSKQMQTYGAVHKKEVDPVRQSVFNDPAYQKRLNDNYPGYAEAYKKTIPDAKIYFTPQPLFFSVTTQWAAALQDMYNNKVSVDEGLDQLAQQINREMAVINNA